MVKRCFMFGHRDTPAGLLPEIERAVERHYREYGVREFIVGQYGTFDRLAAQAVRSVRQKYADIRLILLLPYHPAERSVMNAESYDATLYLDGMEHVPKRLAIVQANKKMVEQADSVICHVEHVGNTRRLLEMAKRRKDQGLAVVENLRGRG